MKKFFILLGTLGAIIAGGMLLGVAVVFLTQPAHAHEAPLGWSYGLECCAGKDCDPLPEAGVHATPIGWLIDETGETIPYGDKRLKVSQDGGFHRCRYAPPVMVDGERRATRCLYVPWQGS